MLTRRHMVGGIAAIALIPSAVLAPINPALAYVAGELATWRAVLPSHLVLTAWLDGKTRNILVVGRNVKNGRELGFALTENLIADGLHERVLAHIIPVLAENLMKHLSPEELVSLHLAERV